MTLYCGTSGYQYKFWRGGLYSEGCKEADMLAEYGRKLPTVEINNTFYRMPKRDVVESWAAQVPQGFRFVIKASRRITHQKRLKDCAEPLGFLFRSLDALGAQLGAVLFQLPPYMRKDRERLASFLGELPSGVRASLEFRHKSWFEDEIFALLREHDAALCISDQGEGEEATPPVSTASWGYLRLRRDAYDEEELSEQAHQIAAQAWSDAFAFFKHEETAPAMAARLMQLNERA
ncbi:MAG: DUF72 domain-containing protein [Myxococcales bacterium]|nr:DUF72 domain-containing protein [Myxococcales bacterium]